MRVHLALVLALAACGDDSGGTIDAPGGGGDGGTDGRNPDSSVPPGCTYTEQHDTTNDASATPEDTSITYSTAISLCGAVQNGHFDAVEQSVDADIYKLTFSADTDLILHFTADAQVLDELAVQVAQSSARAGYGSWLNDHGALVAHVTTGVWYVTVGAFRGTDISSVPIQYRITIETDTAGRCAHVTTGGFTEAGDGSSNIGNDMVEFDAAAQPTKRLTTTTADVPEASGVTVAPGASYRLTGTAANVNASDDYTDRDTYEFTTGPSTNEVSVRLNWPGTRDFDFLVVPQNAVTPLVGTGLDNATSEDEFETFAVKPNTAYWLWVGAYDGSALPVDYDATLCGATYTP